MPDPRRHRVFLSYARADLHAALELRRQIEAELGDGTVWHDVRNLTGDHWWTEIEDAIRGQAAVEHVVLLASAEALARPVVRREWRLAWREGKALTNVFWSARPGFTPPPLGEAQDFVKAKSMLDLSLPDRWQALITRLKEPGQGPRRPFMAPAMPDGFVARPEEFAKLKAALLDTKGNAVAITAALRGAGGFGKTVLAQALAHDDGIQDAFHDGVLWVALGEKPSPIEKLADLLKTLTGEPQGFTEVSAAANKLREVLAERKCLLVIDDVWSEGHLRPFTDGAPLTARLVTTRRDDILPKDTLRVPVDAMTEPEAVELLSQGLGAIGPAEQAALRTLATERLGEWPVIIRLVNGFLRKEVERGAAPHDAISQANDRLDRKKLTVFDRTDEKAREAAVESTIRASIDYLVVEIGKGQDPKVFNDQRYDELAVFPEDVEVPIATIARLWGRVAQVDAIDARDLLKHLYSLALLQALDLKRGTVRLHDVMRKYLTQKQAGEALKGLHHQFVEAYDAASGPDIEDAEERRYFYTWFPTHLHEAGEREVLDGLLLDPQWMQRKLDGLDSPLPLVTDYNRLVIERQSMQGVVGQAITLASGIIRRDRRQFLPQLIGRLHPSHGPELRSLCASARRLITAPAIVPITPSLRNPGAEIGRLEGHIGGSVPKEGGIYCLTSVSSEHLASAGDENEIRIWNTRSLTEAGKLIGHTSWIYSIIAIGDGRLASASGDKTIRIWDVRENREIACLKGHYGNVTALALLPGNRLASAGDDQTIRVWDLRSKLEITRLQIENGALSDINALVAMPDGTLFFPDGHRGICLWNPDAKTHIAPLNGDIIWIRSLIKLCDGFLAIGGNDGSIRLWNRSTESPATTLGKHTGAVLTLLQLNDGRLASAGADKVINLWDLEKRKLSQTLSGHLGDVWAMALFRQNVGA